MAKKIRFPLILAEDTQVRSLDELREHFDLEAVLGYYKTGKLLTWLEDRYLEGEAKAIRALDETAPDFQLRLCETLGVEYTRADVDLETIRVRQERLARLRTITDEDEFLQNIDSVAFDQEELADLLDEERTTVYLCGERFTVPASRKGITYVGINEPEVKISGDLPENFDELGITFRTCKVDRPEPPKPEPLKQEPLKQAYQVEVPQGAKIVALTNVPLDMNVINCWQGVVSVTCSEDGVIGIDRDGNVVAEGHSTSLDRLKDIFENCSWNQGNKIHSIAWGRRHIVWLRRNGTVVAESDLFEPGELCMVDSWTGITAVACSNNHTVGLHRGGTVMAVGKNDYRQCNVQDWKDIVSIGCTQDATFGLKRDGTVVSTMNSYGTENWTDIMSIDCCGYKIVGLKRDGAVVLGRRCIDGLAEKISGWRDIISIVCGSLFTAGLRRDGTVVVVDDTGSKNMMPQRAQKWKNIVSIVAGDSVLVGIVGPED